MKTTLLLCCLPLLASAAARRPPLGSIQPCWDAVKRLNATRDAEGLLPPGAVLPECDRLGKYLPQQCIGSKCVCVDPAGNHLEYIDRTSASDAGGLGGGRKTYAVNIWEKVKQACRCARVEYENSKSTAPGLVQPNCDEKGDYHPTQCHEEECYQVHPHTGEKL